METWNAVHRPEQNEEYPYQVIDEDRDTLGPCYREYEARLIAAAPHLLAALKTATEELRAIHRHHYPDCGRQCPTEEFIRDGEAAIKQATGELP